MSELFPVIFATVVLLILSGLEILLFRLLNKPWWQIKWVRRSSYLLPVLGLIFIGVWVIGIYNLSRTVMIIGATLSALNLIFILALILSLPFSGIIHGINHLFDWLARKKPKPEKAKEPKINLPRRRLLRAAAAVIPLAALGEGANGVFHAFTEINIYKIPIYFKNLPPQLDGFKIFHVSDVHIGYYIWLDKVERMLEEGQKFAPDIVLATGDLSDRLDVYGDFLDLLYQFKAPSGTFASLGNHEYFRGINTVLRTFDKSPVPLLVNNGAKVEYKGANIYIGGADDPRLMHQGDADFFKKTIDNSFQDDTSDTFKILMSHRPRAFDMAAESGIDLTLAGHTHGGQIGLFGRSVFQPIYERAYLWGLYEKGESKLYTSSGVGHWFPFRLGCPAEAPIIELRRGDPGVKS